MKALLWCGPQLHSPWRCCTSLSAKGASLTLWQCSEGLRARGLPLAPQSGTNTTSFCGKLPLPISLPPPHSHFNDVVCPRSGDSRAAQRTRIRKQLFLIWLPTGRLKLEFLGLVPRNLGPPAASPDSGACFQPFEYPWMLSRRLQMLACWCRLPLQAHVQAESVPLCDAERGGGGGHGPVLSMPVGRRCAGDVCGLGH